LGVSTKGAVTNASLRETLPINWTTGYLFGLCREEIYEIWKVGEVDKEDFVKTFRTTFP